jgi:hypothetical protein
MLLIIRGDFRKPEYSSRAWLGQEIGQSLTWLGQKTGLSCEVGSVVQGGSVRLVMARG